MQKLNEITPKDIQTLGENELPRLLDKLLRCEANKYNISPRIHVPYNTKAKDGGKDGEIIISVEDFKKLKSKWITDKHCVFQCKASDIFPKDLYQEFFTDKTFQKIKPAVEEVLDKGGKYIFFIHKEYTDLKSRIEKCTEAINKMNEINKEFTKNYKPEQIEILEANRIAQWVNENISAVVLVQDFCNFTRPLGIKTWQEWKRHTTSLKNTLKYELSKDLENKKNEIIERIKQEKVLRIIGHSGIGKTRLVLETFDPIDENLRFFSEALVYIDLQSTDIKEISPFIDSCIYYHGLVILDNCDDRTHNLISDSIQSTGNLKLITIFNSVEKKEDYYIKIDKCIQSKTVRQIFHNKYGNSINYDERERLINFCDGYPKMAHKICEIIDKEGFQNLNLNANKFDFIKQIIFGFEKEDKEILAILKACAIFKEFGFIDHDLDVSDNFKQKITKQHELIIEKVCKQNIKLSRFEEIIHDLKTSKEIFDRRGYTFYITPEPLAIILAMEWLKPSTHMDFVEFANQLEEVGLLEPFCARLKSLDQLPEARSLVQKLWGLNSPFASAEVLNTEMGSLLFRSVVEVNPEETAKALRELTRDKSIEEIKNIKLGRRNLVWAIEKLLYREEAFYDTATTLLDLAAGENENIGNNATGIFNQLFNVILSGSVVSFDERLEIIKYGLEKNLFEYNHVIVKALGESFNSYNHKFGGAERQGLVSVYQDYRYKSGEEVISYWQQCLDIFINFVKNTDLRNTAKENIAKSIYVLYHNKQLKIIKDAITKVLEIDNTYWESAFDTFNRILKYECSDDRQKSEVQSLIDIIKPKDTDIENRIKMLISLPNWNSEKNENGEYIDIAANNVAVFTEELFNKKVNIEKYFYLVVKGEQRQGFSFGINLVRIFNKPLEHGKLLIQELEKLETKEQNISVLSGILNSCNRITKKQLLDIIINSNKSYIHAFYLTSYSNPDEEDLNKLFKIIDNNLDNLTYFRAFISCRFISLSATSIINFCKKIAKYNILGGWIAFNIINQYNASQKVSIKDCKKFIKELLVNSNLLAEIDVYNMNSYYWNEICINILEEGRDEKFADILCKQISNNIENISKANFNVTNISLYLIQNYRSIFWEYIAEMLQDFRQSLYLEFVLGSGISFDENKMGILFVGDTNHIFEWCKRNQSAGLLAIAKMMPLFELDNNQQVHIHPLAENMLKEFSSNENFLRQISSNLHSFGSSGSRIPYYYSRIQVLEKIILYNNRNLTQWAKKEISNFQKDIKLEKLNEETYKR